MVRYLRKGLSRVFKKCRVKKQELKEKKYKGVTKIGVTLKKMYTNSSAWLIDMSRVNSLSSSSNDCRFDYQKCSITSAVQPKYTWLYVCIIKKRTLKIH